MGAQNVSVGCAYAAAYGGVESAQTPLLLLCSKLHYVCFSLCISHCVYVYFTFCCYYVVNCISTFIMYILMCFFIMTLSLCVAFLYALAHALLNAELRIITEARIDTARNVRACARCPRPYLRAPALQHKRMRAFRSMCIIIHRTRKMADWGWCISTLRRNVGDLEICDGGRHMEIDVVDAYEVQLERVFRELVGVQVLGNLSDQVTMGIDHVRNALSIVRNLLESNERQMEIGYHAPITAEGRLGRPRFHIPRNQLACLLEKGFTVPQISNILRVSVRTVRRRMAEYDLSVHALYSELTDQELEWVIRDIQDHFPTCGNRQMQGHLLSQGIRVQQYRVREIRRKVNPAGSVMHRLQTINRRKYQVNGPFALWHIDGNHKLIRYINILLHWSTFTIDLAPQSQHAYLSGHFSIIICYLASIVHFFYTDGGWSYTEESMDIAALLSTSVVQTTMQLQQYYHVSLRQS